jgi:Uma2 family endonuclease
MIRKAADIPLREAEPAWEIARLFPAQGTWSEEDYLALTRDTNWLVEFSDGQIEVLPMPKQSHQLIVQFLNNLLFAFVTSANLGRMLFAPLRVRLRKDKFREPDIVFMLAEHSQRMGEDFWEGADLVMEVVSEDPEDRHRDLVTKRKEYAEAGIPEYWIVDPREQQISILRLKGSKYSVAAVHSGAQVAKSHILPGFSVQTSKVFAAGAGKL